jgi:CRISPR system Cascade subunit CasC
MNMQKSAIFGGKRRVRISSQSLKRTIRHSDYYKQHLGECSIRTIHLGQLQELILAKLNKRFDENTIKTAIQLISGKEGITTDTAYDAVAPWIVEEVAYYCEQVKKTGSDKVDPKKLQKQIEKEGEALRRNLCYGLDIALSGRMATSGLLSELGKVDGALAVAHAITTHAIDADIDWFTATDDLQALGAGHLNTQEFSSGVFYRYASINLKQLQMNLGLIPAIHAEETNESRKKALDIAAHIAHMLATEVPSAKQQSFAAHNLADLMMISLSNLPISMANAFEEPISAGKNGGFIFPSINALHDYWQSIYKGYKLDEDCAEFSVHAIELPAGINKKDSLPEIEEWIRKNGK